MLWLERQIVASLVSPTIDQRGRDEIEAYVDGALRSMPEYLRAGVGAESLAFGAWPRLQQTLGRLDPTALAERVDRWKTSRLDPVRQYVRLLQSLVLFAENELIPPSAP
jgi:hypothetical protein